MPNAGFSGTWPLLGMLVTSRLGIMLQVLVLLLPAENASNIASNVASWPRLAKVTGAQRRKFQRHGGRREMQEVLGDQPSWRNATTSFHPPTHQNRTQY